MTDQLVNPQDVTAELLTRIAANATPLRPGDPAEFEAQLGRIPRGLVGVGARCACGRPAVTVTLPRLPDGTPFPTVFYLSLPYLVKEMSRLEAAGVMAELNQELIDNAEWAAGHAAAHTEYVQRRALLGHVPEIDGVSAGGMPTRVKCLHALAGFAVSVGPGICSVGDKALAMIEWDSAVCHCE